MDLLEKHLKQPPPDTEIWRYMDLPKFLSLIHNRALYFPQFSSLDDSYEGSLTWVTSKEIYELLSLHRPDHYEFVREYSFVSCWHMNDHESAAMWKLYLSNNQGIAVKTTVGKLTGSLSLDKYLPYVLPPKMGLMIYRNDRIVAEPASGDWASDSLSLFCKRKSFEYEQEYRVVFEGTQGIHEIVKEGGLSIPIDPENLIEEVYIAPTAPIGYSLCWSRYSKQSMISIFRCDNHRWMRRRYGRELGVQWVYHQAKKLRQFSRLYRPTLKRSG